MVVSDEIRPGKEGGSLYKLLWIYFFLLIFEGSVRKWIPPLSNAFLLIRDPIALLLWIEAIRHRIGPRHVWSIFHFYALAIAMLGTLQVIIVGANPLAVLYGWRSYVLHVPVLLVLAFGLGRAGLVKLVRSMVILTIPMTLLMVAQYSSGPESFLNRGAGEFSQQIAGAAGHIRAAGTFSFIAGPAMFYPLALSLLLWTFESGAIKSVWLKLGGATAILIALPISVSRTLALSAVSVLIAAAIGLLIRGISVDLRALNRLLMGAVGFLIFVMLVAQLPIFRDAVETFTARWTQAQGGEGDNSRLLDRVIEPFQITSDSITTIPMIGVGIGEGSQVASALEGRPPSSFGENAVSRELVEMGWLMGGLMVGIRLSLTVILVVQATKAIRSGASLAWLLLPSTVSYSLYGGFDQPTLQGFMMVTLGMFFAALKVNDHQKLAEEGSMIIDRQQLSNSV
jgi:hypothetical protein